MDRVSVLLILTGVAFAILTIIGLFAGWWPPA
jgi:hypothetical protein